MVDMMCQGAWLSGVSDKLLAKHWQCTPDNVRKISAEASRLLLDRLRDDPKAQKEMRAQIMQTFDVIRAKAMAKGDPASLRVALDATRALGFYYGIEPAKRLDVSSREGDFMQGWSTEEKIAYSKDGERARRRAAKRAAGAVAAVRQNGANSHDGDDSLH